VGKFVIAATYILQWLQNVQATSPLAAQVRTALPHK